jgi:hypothetical protein
MTSSCSLVTLPEFAVDFKRHTFVPPNDIHHSLLLLFCDEFLRLKLITFDSVATAKCEFVWAVTCLMIP